jgi:hypothetical protein
LDIVAEQNNKAVDGVTRPSCMATRPSIRYTSHLDWMLSLISAVNLAAVRVEMLLPRFEVLLFVA